jgi:hypothetical protein
MFKTDRGKYPEIAIRWLPDVDGFTYELALEYRLSAVRQSRREATIIKIEAAAKCPSNGHGFDVA